MGLRVTRENLVPLTAIAPYFALGLTSFLAAPWVLAAGSASLDGGFYRDPAILAAVHLYALGWGTAVALGALQQMTAVVFATVLHSSRLAQAAFAAFLLGLSGLITGLATLAQPGLARAALAAAALGLPLGAVLALTNVSLTLRSGQPTVRGNLIRPFVLSAGGYLVLAFLAGAALAVNLVTGWLGLAWRSALALHVAAAAGGWFLMLIIGISYHLLTFFGLVEKKQQFRWPGAVRRLLHGGVGLVILAAVFRAAGTEPVARAALPAAAWAVAAACVLFVWDGWGIYAPREPERMHPGVVYVRVAHLYLSACALALAGLGVVGVLGSPLPAQGLTALAFLAAAGWLSNTILGYLHRILPFVVWHNRYWGRAREPGVPAFRHMVHQPLAWAACAVYNAGVVGSVVALLSAWPAGPFLVLLGAGAAAAALNLIRTLLK
ncbi:MAG TPA: hypothetical protein VIK98_07805 [Limnochordales bacterium]